METILKHSIIKGFLSNFTHDQKIMALKYISIIGIEYIANFSNDTNDLFQIIKSIASKIIVFYFIYIFCCR